jgi:hypothetical protein
MDFDKISSYRIVEMCRTHQGRFGLAVVALSSNRWLTVRAIHGGSPTALRVKTG